LENNKIATIIDYHERTLSFLIHPKIEILAINPKYFGTLQINEFLNEKMKLLEFDVSLTVLSGEIFLNSNDRRKLNCSKSSISAGEILSQLKNILEF
jgi:hypothetical protein